jgi:rhodanese-related sulfurtransferase
VAAVSEIGLKELQRRLSAADPPILVDALSQLSFAHSRLPGAINIPPERVDELAPRLLPDRDAEIVVYCEGPDCDASVEASQRLAELGYTEVRHFAEGKRGWAKAGLEFERGPRPARVRRIRSS